MLGRLFFVRRWSRRIFHNFVLAKYLAGESSIPIFLLEGSPALALFCAERNFAILSSSYAHLPPPQKRNWELTLNYKQKRQRRRCKSFDGLAVGDFALFEAMRAAVELVNVLAPRSRARNRVDRTQNIEMVGDRRLSQIQALGKFAYRQARGRLAEHADELVAAFRADDFEAIGA